MRILKGSERKTEVSVILLDWKVRESFHSLDYLSRQTVDRNRYEILWIEFYDHVPAALLNKTRENPALIDQWLTLDFPGDVYFHKHFAYNVGIALSNGRICVICDSDAMFPENFIEKIIGAFMGEEKTVIHVDEVRNANRKFYPFNYPVDSEVIFDRMTTNWSGTTTQGLNNSADMIHEANYGACMAALRSDLISIGGADEHLEYLGYICGPYEMTFRLVNKGHQERWLRDVFLIHTWHPSEGGAMNYGGRHDGRGFSARALEVRSGGGIMAEVENQAIRALRGNERILTKDLIGFLELENGSAWNKNSKHLVQLQPPVMVRENIYGNNIIQFEGCFYAIPQARGSFVPDEVKQGKYNHLAKSSNLEELLERIQNNIALQVLPIHTLVRETEYGHNIIHYDGIYYAMPQGEGEFIPGHVANGLYKDMLSDRNSDSLLARLARDAEQVRVMKDRGPTPIKVRWRSRILRFFRPGN